MAAVFFSGYGGFFSGQFLFLSSLGFCFFFHGLIRAPSCGAILFVVLPGCVDSQHFPPPVVRFFSPPANKTATSKRMRSPPAALRVSPPETFPFSLARFNPESSCVFFSPEKGMGPRGICFFFSFPNVEICPFPFLRRRAPLRKVRRPFLRTNLPSFPPGERCSDRFGSLSPWIQFAASFFELLHFPPSHIMPGPPSEVDAFTRGFFAGGGSYVIFLFSFYDRVKYLLARSLPPPPP